MYLVIYTQKTESPYIIKIYLIVLFLALLVLASLVSLIIYSGLKAITLQTETHILSLRKIEAEVELARVDTEIPGLKKRLSDLQQQRNMRAVLGENLTLHPDSSTYAVQISAHRSFQDAERMVQSIRPRISLSVAVQPVRLATGLWFRALVTPFDTRAEAQNYAESLVKQKIIGEYYIQRIPRVSDSSDTGAAIGPQN